MISSSISISGASIRAPIFEAFRLVARRTVYFRRKVSKVGVEFLDCPDECDRPKVDAYCAGCKKGELYRGYKAKCGADLEKIKAPYKVETLISDLSEVMTIEAGAGEDRTDGEWTELTALLVSILRGERHKATLIDNWNADEAARDAEKRKRQNAAGS